MTQKLVNPVCVQKTDLEKNYNRRINCLFFSSKGYQKIVSFTAVMLLKRVLKLTTEPISTPKIKWDPKCYRRNENIDLEKMNNISSFKSSECYMCYIIIFIQYKNFTAHTFLNHYIIMEIKNSNETQKIYYLTVKIQYHLKYLKLLRFRV